jgi:small subunit ribosomal protein S2
VATTEEVRPDIGVKDLLDAGLHFGHQTKRWNPKMKRYIFDKRNGIHIIDLGKSLALLQKALEFVEQVTLSGKSVLFVGTKKQAQQVIKETAASCNQPCVTVRWLGGTLTNIATIRRSVKRLRELEELEKAAFANLHKKEASSLRHELEKLRRNLTGIVDMSELPGAVFVVDISREAIAIAEANKLGIQVVAIVDTNCDPDPVDYVIPGNDDAIRGIRLIAGKIAEAARKGAAEYAKAAAELARKREAEKAEAEAARAAAKKAAEEAAAAGEKAEKPAERKAAPKAAAGRPESARARAAAKTPPKAESSAQAAAAAPAAPPAKPAAEAEAAKQTN